MTWEHRKNRPYYYRKRRCGRKVVSEYVGSGQLAQAASALAAREQQLHRAARQQCAVHRALDAQVNHACNLIQALASAVLLLAGHHTHKGQWRRKRVDCQFPRVPSSFPTHTISGGKNQMTDRNPSLPPKPEPAVVSQFLQLVNEVDKANPAPAHIQSLRRMLDAHPELWRVAGDLAQAAARSLVDQLDAGPLVAESLQRGWLAMQEELGYPAASPLERLLIEEVVLRWLHLRLVDLEYAAATGRSILLPSAEHWERRTSAAQRRYLGACETLARIRKLALTTPALQVNIAAQGGQQVNLLGG